MALLTRGAHRRRFIDTSAEVRILSAGMVVRRRSTLMLCFIAFAIVATLGHICVLPGHVHAAVADAGDHGHTVPVEPHHDSTDDTAYGESCDALRPGSSTPGATLLAAITTAIASADIRPRLVAQAIDATPPRASPPLYVIHRALLI